MKNRRFMALGDLIADCYYIEKKKVGIDGGSTRFNVIANLANMNCQTVIVGGCGNDQVGRVMIKRLKDMGVDVSKIFLRNRKARAYHLQLDKRVLPKVSYQCSKESPLDGETTWYEDGLDDSQYYYSEVNENDTVVLDMVDEMSLDVLQNVECDKILDIGNSKRLELLQDEQIAVLENRIEILQLNERVVPYLMKRFHCTSTLEIYKLLKPKLLIITYGKEGAEFVFGDTVYNKKLINSVKELDPTGAGDAFLSVFAKSYYEKLKKIDKQFIDSTFEQAILLTSTVVQHIGARGHLYERKLDKFTQIELEDDDVEL